MNVLKNGNGLGLRFAPLCFFTGRITICHGCQSMLCDPSPYALSLVSRPLPGKESGSSRRTTCPCSAGESADSRGTGLPYGLSGAGARRTM